MLVVSLAMVVILAAPAPSSDAARLVDQLGSPRYVRREAAGHALEQLGRSAVPALRAGLESRDPEVRARSSALLTRIEEGLLVQPTMIALDLHDEPLPKALAAINARTGLELAMTPENHPDWHDTRLTVRTAAPLPFWSAVDALCAAGHMHYAFGAPAQPGQGEAAFPLYPGDAPTTGLISDSGPFRVQLASIHSQSDIQLARVQATANARARSVEEVGGRFVARGQRQFFFQLVVAAEPRLAIAQNGPARMTLAVDDRGNSLLASPTVDTIQPSPSHPGVGNSQGLPIRVDLNRPEAAGGQIRVLRGSVPVMVSTRKPSPMTIPLGASTGKTFRDDQVALAVVAVHPATTTQPATVEITARPLASGSRLALTSPRPEATAQQIEILDDRGISLPWYQTNASYEGVVARFTLALLSRGPGVPASIRFHEVARASSDVPFEFRDVPMP